MKRFILFSIAFCLCAVYAFAQAKDSTVTIVLPTKLDFTTLAGFQQTLGLLVSAVLTVIMGFWAKGSAFLAKYLPTTEKRVAFVGLIVSIGAGLAFGFSANTISTIFTALIGVLAGIGGFGVLSPKKETA